MRPLRETTRSNVRAALLTIAVATLLWAIWITLAGGFITSIAGLRIRSNNPQRVLMFTAIALGGYFLLGGAIPIARLAAAGRRSATAMAGHPGVIAALLAIASSLVAIAGSTRMAGGSDAYGYVSQADLWLQGSLEVRQPWVAEVPWPDAKWTFTPLGYRPAFALRATADKPAGKRGEREGEWSIVPTYSPGLPMLLALAKRIGGQCVMFGVVPILAGVTVLATYGIGRRLHSPVAGLIAAWLVATSPVTLNSSLEPLTDVPVMAMWTLAFFFVLAARGETPAAFGWRCIPAGRVAPRSNTPGILGRRALPAGRLATLGATLAFHHGLLGTSSSSAAAAGVSAGLAILIRPNLVPLAVPLGVWFLFRRDVPGPSVGTRLGPAAAFAVTALAGVAAVGLINQHLYGAAATSGYGRLEDQVALARVLPNFLRYTSWFIETHTVIPLLGLIALAAPLPRFWPGVADRRIFAVLGSVIVLLWGFYCAYHVFDSWGYLRFLLPSWPLIMNGFGALAVWVAGLGRAARWVSGVAIVALGVWNTSEASRLDVFEQRQAARHEAPIGRLVTMHTAPNSVLLTSERSGSMRYYGGRVTLRYDLLDPEWLDRAVAWLTARGVRVYAVLDGRQADEVRARFPTQRAATALDRPFLIYEPAGTALFDLSQPRDPALTPVVITEPFPDAPHCDPPVPLLPLLLK